MKYSTPWNGTWINSPNPVTNSAGTSSPYGELYIYYIEGRAGHWDGMFGRDFMGNWEEDGFSFLFFSTPAQERVDDFLKARDDLILIDEYHMSYEEWHGEMPAPFFAGSISVVPFHGAFDEVGASVPAHHAESFRHPDSHASMPLGFSDSAALPSVEKDPVCEGTRESKSVDRNSVDRNSIYIDPGVVFGVGNHPTTRDCMEALDLAFANGPIETALDIGTGSGILSLGAATLGCGHTLAMDLNFLAAKTAQHNVRINGMEKRVGVVCGSAIDFMTWPFDLMIANIHYDVMKRMMVPEVFSNKRYIILSGLLRSQAEKIARRLDDMPVEIQRRWSENGIWHTFFMTVKR